MIVSYKTFANSLALCRFRARTKRCQYTLSPWQDFKSTDIVLRFVCHFYRKLCLARGRRVGPVVDTFSRLACVPVDPIVCGSIKLAMLGSSPSPMADRWIPKGLDWWNVDWAHERNRRHFPGPQAPVTSGCCLSRCRQQATSSEITVGEISSVPGQISHSDCVKVTSSKSVVFLGARKPPPELT